MKYFCYIYVIVNYNDMDEVTRMLEGMPRAIRVRDDGNLMMCFPSFFYSLDRKERWCAAYFCGRHDYFFACVYGDTLLKAVTSLKE